MNIDAPSVSILSEEFRLSEFLDSIESESSTGKSLLKLGIDTNFVNKMRKFLKNPMEGFNEVAELSSKTYATFFVEAIKTDSNLKKAIKEIDFEIKGSNLSIWIFLKKKFYNYENRAALYKLKAEFSNSELFSIVDVDFLVLEEGEVDAPKCYTKI
jgi:hypothetical protein